MSGRGGGMPRAPSLFSGGTEKQDRRAERISILSSLDRGGVSQKSAAGGRRALYAAAGVLLLCVAVWGVASVLSGDPGSKVAAASPASSHQSSVLSPAVAEGTVSQAATIENVSPAPTIGDPASEGNRVVDAVDAGVNASTSVGFVKAEADRNTVGRLSLNELASTETNSNAVPASLPPAEAAVATKAKRAAKPAPASGGPGKRTGERPAVDQAMAAGRDSDATLLAVLVAHEEGIPIEVKPRAAAGSAKAPAGKRGQGSSRKKQSEFDPERDIVEDDKSITTAELVRRCGTLGLVEGFLCKLRVCAARQDSDPACPQPATATARGG